MRLKQTSPTLAGPAPGKSPNPLQDLGGLVSAEGLLHLNDRTDGLIQVVEESRPVRGQMRRGSNVRAAACNDPMHGGQPPTQAMDQPGVPQGSAEKVLDELCELSGGRWLG